MKKINLLLLFVFLSVFSFAQIDIYAPNLKLPENNAENQMPNAVLDWDAVAGSLLINYEAQIDTDSLFSNPVIFNTELTSVENQFLLFNQKYFWRVRAIDGNDTSAWTETRAFTVFDNICFTKPQSGSEQKKSSVDLLWKKQIDGLDISGIKCFDCQLDTTWNFNSPALINNTVDSTVFELKINNIQFGTRYYWRVRARHDIDTSAWTTDFFYVVDSMPMIPKLISPPDNIENYYLNPNLSWSEIYGTKKYIIALDTNQNFNNQYLFETEGTSLSLPNDITILGDSINFLFGHNYYWRVKAIGEADSSGWSNLYKFTTAESTHLVSPINNDTLVSFNNNKMKLIWRNIGAEKYYYEIDTTFNFSDENSLLKGYTDDTVLLIKKDSINLGTKYFWSIRGININNNDTIISNWSEIESYTTPDTILIQPQLITPDNFSKRQYPLLNLVWRKVYLDSLYQIEIDTTSDFNNQYLFETKNNETLSLPNDTTISGDTIHLLYGHNYYWRVKALTVYDTLNWTDFSETHEFTIIDTLNIYTPHDDTAHQELNLKFVWEDILGTDYYDIQIDTTPNFEPTMLLVNDSTTNPTYDTSFHYLQTDYFWRIRARNEYDESAWSVHTFKTLDTIPSAPSLLYPLNMSINQMTTLTLEWNKLSGTDNYEVQISETDNFADPQIFNTSNTKQYVENLLFGKNYYWRVKASNEHFSSPWSEIWSFSTFNIYEPQIFSPYEGEVDINTDMGISWLDTISGITNYEIQLDTISTFNSAQILSKELTFDSNLLVFFTNLYFNKKYYWRIRVINDCDTSLWSSSKSFNTINNVNLIYPEVNAINQYPKISLRWESLPGAKSYDYQIDTVNTFNGSLISGFVDKALYFIDVSIDNLHFGEKYYWRIRAKNNNGVSAWSEIRNFTITNEIRLISPEDGAEGVDLIPTLKWENIPGINEYILQYDSLESFSNNLSFILNDTLNGSYYLSSPLTSNTKYYWRICGKNGTELTNWSSTREFTTLNTFGYNDLMLNENTRVNLYPNPCQNNINISIISEKTSIISLKLINLMGVVIYDKKVNLESNINKIIELNTNNIPKGIYILKIIRKNSFISKKIIILK